MIVVRAPAELDDAEAVVPLVTVASQCIDEGRDLYVVVPSPSVGSSPCSASRACFR